MTLLTPFLFHRRRPSSAPLFRDDDSGRRAPAAIATLPVLDPEGGTNVRRLDPPPASIRTNSDKHKPRRRVEAPALPTMTARID